MSMRTRRTPRDLVVWQNGIDLSDKIYEITRRYPKNETFGLISQMRRAAVSIPSNIAEGAARGSHREFLHFLQIARGSLAELESLVFISQKIGVLPADSAEQLRTVIDRESALLNGLISVTRPKADSGRSMKGVAPKIVDNRS